MAETTGAAVRCLHAADRERPGDVGRGAAAADIPVGQLASGWPTPYRSRWEMTRRRGYPQLHSPLGSTVTQAAELRLCLNPPHSNAHIVILAAQKAANQHK